MRTTSRVRSIAPFALACAVGAVLLASGTLVAGDNEAPTKEAEAIQPAKAAETQEEALKRATEEDLPAIAKGDKVVIKQFFSAEEFFDDAKEITVEDEDTLKQIREILTVGKVEASLGEMKYKLHFYLGDVLIREVWVFPYGEWGIVRGGPDWPLGLNENLADLLDELFEEAD